MNYKSFFFYIHVLGIPSLQYVFDNYTFYRQVYPPNPYTIGLTGFGMSSSNPILYYVTNSDRNKIYVYDEDWNYVSEKSNFTRPNYMILVDSYFFITGDNYIWKTDQLLNVLITYTHNGSYSAYRGLYYNSTNSLIYVTSYWLREIQIFNLNLTLTDTISTPQYNTQKSINGYNNQLYVGADHTILIISNKQIIQNLITFTNYWDYAASMVFDKYDNMAIACSDRNLYLYHANGTYLNKKIFTMLYNEPQFVGFDSNSRLVILMYYANILLYN